MLLRRIDMSSNNQDLEARVAQLETTLAQLIENLADNNAKLIEALYEITGSDDRTAKSKLDAVKKFESGICPNDPPKCKKKDKDKD
jgi:hypothetical protein